MVARDSDVSMDFRGLTPGFLPMPERGFAGFFKGFLNSPKGGYLLPVYIGQLLREGREGVKVPETRDTRYGVTCKEDKQTVTDAMRAPVERGAYREDLYSGL